jgi:hypothetical protein
MYTQEQMRQEFQKQLEKQKQYTENSIDEAREKWDKARDLVRHIEAGGRSVYDIYEARQRENDANREMQDAIANSSHLRAAKQVREQQEKLQAEKVKEQQAFAVEEKKKFRAEALQRWLAVGGTEQQFSEQFESMWTEEVRRRTTQAVGDEEQMFERMRASGRYGGRI